MTVALGGAVGTVVGIALPYVSSLRTILNPILVVLGTIPVLILLPFLIQWFGNGRLVRRYIEAVQGHTHAPAFHETIDAATAMAETLRNLVARLGVMEPRYG